MGITKESIECLKSSADIVDIIGDAMELKKAGANWKGCCPFHGEKTPSFVVSPSKQIYHCFGCGVGGDVFKFLQELQKLSFVEAVEEVAKRCNFALEYDSSGSQRKDYSRTLDVVAGYFVDSLRESDKKYLKSRGLSAKSIRDWGLGYAPRSPEQIKAFDALLLPKDELLELQILRESERGVYAHFTDRVMFTIRDHRGKVVGWSGRSLKEGIKAKYVNSMDSKVFNKSALLYGFDRAKDEIYKKKFVIIVEGQLDVIMAHQVKIGTAVAAQGTALTEQHLPLLKKTGAKVVLAYDGDKAGRTAALKGATLLSTHGFSGGVVLFPEGEDPASMIAEGREDEVKRLLMRSEPLVHYVVRSIAGGYKLSDPYAKDEALKACVKYLNSLGNAMVAGEYVGFVAGVLGVDVQHVRLDGVSVHPPLENRDDKKVTAEELLLYSMYEKPHYVDIAVSICDDEAFFDREKYVALLRNKQSEEMFASLLLRENVRVLGEKQFLHALRVKQRQYLTALKKELQSRGAGIDEILAVNDRMKRV